jgi:hypothetical protein
MLNRAAVLLRYKAPALAWINEADPYDREPGITLDVVNDGRTVYLVHEDDVDPPEVLSSWIEQNFLALFENELDGWYADESLWLKKRNFSTFNEWFSVKCHSIVIDTVGGDIIDDEM